MLLLLLTALTPNFYVHDSSICEDIESRFEMYSLRRRECLCGPWNVGGDDRPAALQQVNSLRLPYEGLESEYQMTSNPLGNNKEMKFSN